MFCLGMSVHHSLNQYHTYIEINITLQFPVHCFGFWRLLEILLQPGRIGNRKEANTIFVSSEWKGLIRNIFQYNFKLCFMNNKVFVFEGMILHVGNKGNLPVCPLVFALVPLKGSSRNLQFPHRVTITKEKIPWCPCPL